MADAKLSDLVALAGADVATNDLLYIVDVSAAASGSKKITTAEFWAQPITVTGTVEGPLGVTERNGVLITTPEITTAVGRGLNVVMDWSGTYGATAIQAKGTVSGDGSHEHCYGLQSWMYHTSTGTTDQVAGLMATLNASAGTVTEWCGLLFPSIITTGATVTKAWHIKAESARRSYLPGGLVVSDLALTTPINTTSASGGVLRSHHARGALAGGTGITGLGAFVISTDTAAAGMGGAIALGGESGAASTPYPFAYLMGAKESAGATYNGYLAIHTTNTDSNNTEKMRVTGTGGNVCIGTTAAGTNGVKVLALGSGTAPESSPADAAQLYVADQAAGNACIHTRTEGGAVIKLYQGAAVANPGAGEAEAKLIELLTILRAQGLIAT